MIVHTNWVLTPEKVAVHLPTGTAVIADLHLGYDSVRRRGGDALPAFGIEEAVAALGAVAARIKVARLVIAGDLCEDGRCPEAVIEMVDWLKRNGVELAGVVPGNHDKGLHKAGFPFPLLPDGLLLGDEDGWRVVHGDGKLPRGRVIHGHEHPCIRWESQISAPCYLVGKQRIVLPAFSSDAAGVNVLRDARWRNYKCYVLTGARTLDFGLLATLPKRLVSSQAVSKLPGY